MRNVLVTGGAGYIGSHTCKALAKAGYCPVTYDNLSCGHAHAVRFGPLEIGDLHHAQRLHSVLKHYQPIAVLHFAAFTAIGESVRDPLKFYINNVSGSLSLLKATQNLPIIFSSSCAVYGEPLKLPLDEEHPYKPLSPYGHSKRMVEQIIEDLHIPYAFLRYFNACGADPDGELGEEHDPETHLIPLVIDAALQKRPPLSLFGSDYATPDGSAIRDYIHVSDLAKAHVLALEHLLSTGQSFSVNLGTGEGTSVFEIVRTVERILNKKVPHTIVGRRPGDCPILVASSEKAKNLLNWKPNHTSLEEIVLTAIKWSLR